MANPTAGVLHSASKRVDFWLFVFMLILALVGVGVTQIDDGGLWHYWFVLVVIYAVISIVRAWQGAKADPSRPIWPLIRAVVLHWIGALVAIKIVLLFEFSGITDRGAASTYALLLLALTCYLAGVHFDISFMLLGIILAVIAVAMGYLDQLSIIYAFVLPLAVISVWIVGKRKFS